MSKWGGPLRLLAPGDFFWPKMLSFSPDDRFLVGISNFVLIVIDVQHASIHQPLPPGIGAYEPDWSPKGDTIIYWRWPGFPATPDDSAGFYFLNPFSGNQRILLDETGQRVYGSNPLWTRDGQEIAFLRQNLFSNSVCLVRGDGTDLRVLATSAEHGYYKPMLWYTRPILGIERLIFGQISGPRAGDYEVNRDGSGLARTSLPLGSGGVPSPDGCETVYTATNPVDGLSVLFIRGMDDRTGATVRQLTRFSLPPANGQARREKSRFPQ